jgi:glycosyltransferase involved in cell wall biosynthesis
MAGAIIELKENYDLAINYGINARKKALIKHDKNVIANDLLKIYQDILAN